MSGKKVVLTTMMSSLDSLLTRGSSVIGYGWIFHETTQIKSISLMVELENGQMFSMPVSYNKQRNDVSEAFPQYPWARFSGFLFYVGWDGPKLSKIYLEGSLADGQTFIQLLSIPVNTIAEGLYKGEKVAGADAGVSRLVGRIKYAVTQLNQGALWNFVKRIASGMPALSNEDKSVLSSVRSELARVFCAQCTLIIDHDLGGGANHYREKLIVQRLIEAPAVIVLTFEVQTLRYALEIRTDGVNSRHMLDDMAVIIYLSKLGLVNEVFYNDGVSFPRPDEIPELLVSLKQIKALSLTFAIHDYFSVCPSQFLLNAEGRYCGIPDIAECQRCLPINGEGFATLFTSRNILLWRKKWGLALMAADHIVCFSKSSKTLLKRAYPLLEDGRVSIIPHETEKRMHWQPRINLLKGLHLGVVGSIGIHKGAAIVQGLADEIARRQLPIRITVFGSIDLPCEPSVVDVTGPYRLEELPLIIEKSGANVFIVPSICPETFSYVTQELMAMNAPVVCFDFGAPAERVGAYDRGLVLPLTPGRQLLDDVLGFHCNLVKSRLENSKL